MNITTATAKIVKAHQAGLISDEEASRLQRMIRRTGDYGNKWSWQRQSEARANLLKDFA